MPTENRSTHTEQLVSVPRAEIEAAAERFARAQIFDFSSKLNALLAQPAAQHQGEPVAWQYRVSAGAATGWSLWHEGKGEKFRDSYQVETRPLFTHAATGEGFSAGDMADQGAKAFAARDPEVEELRTQLAEAQEVLRDCIEVGELDAETEWKAKRVSAGRRLYVDDRALSAGAALQRQS
ncbi:hypothetical protein KC131_24455 [Pseudomonas sp. JQ170]|uniref:hypothetical protein n=1 Tax=unclassified Pseudomonas TaxID=196821 RepID=UPI00264BA88C|nr:MULTISPECIES: hypothetical protein [unclassified Pseudomonas]MDN7143803.1 hypothetical protein [Pseudomonas sp. JQ170]WRO77719.1 hypothetical protein U9R80_08595 [Pseudomonas sp. 170C]